MENLRNRKGLTLIALIITIIVLLILAGVSLGAVFGDNGVVTSSTEAKLATENGETLEILRLSIYDKATANSDDIEKMSELDYLRSVGKINFDNTVNVDKIKAQNSYGRGNLSRGDIYVIRDGYLYYINNKKEEKELGKIFNEKTVVEKDIFKYEGNKIIGIKDEYIKEEKDSEGRIYARYLILDEKVYSDNNINMVDIKISSDRATIIGEGAFQDFKNINTVIIENGITEICMRAFYCCDGLLSIKISDDITKIGDYAFFGCTNLEKIYISNSVKNMGYGVFEAWKDSQRIEIQFKENEIPEKIGDSGWNTEWNNGCNANIEYEK